jgi:predicted RNA-binding protein Jag
MYTDEERQAMRERLAKATEAAKKVLKKGDRITVRKCPGTKRRIIFDHWEGNEIISSSGEGEYAATSISRLNGEPVNFNG